MGLRLKTSPDSRLLDHGPAAARPSRTVALAASRPRVDTIDFLRGLVMIIMVLDHTRDFVGMSGTNPRDVHDAALFLTRWVTHFCAPVFVLLSGVSAYLYGARGRTTGELAHFLLTRGLWLIVAELTLVRLGWRFNFDTQIFVFQVIWVIGASMVVLSGLVRLPRWAIAAFGLALILGHNLLDGFEAANLGTAGVLWHFLHEPARLHLDSGINLFPLYSLIPWVGVMAAGYALGPVMQYPTERRRRWLAAAGVVTIAGFVLLRAPNFYGDPAPWAVQDSALATVLAFVNCEKYPPSALYLAMTLGPALVLLALFGDRRPGLAASVVVTFGRVPFFFYVAHLFLVHAVAVVVAGTLFGDAAWLFKGLPISSKPVGYGLHLPGVYAIWVVVLVALYPLCRWFAALKQRRRDWWLSYL